MGQGEISQLSNLTRHKASQALSSPSVFFYNTTLHIPAQIHYFRINNETNFDRVVRRIRTFPARPLYSWRRGTI